MSSVDEAIEALKRISELGYGKAIIRVYTELGHDVPYKPISFKIHKNEDNPLHYPEDYGDWIEADWNITV